MQPASKTCLSCKTQKRADPEFFHRDGRRPDGFRNVCKACRAVERTALRLRNLDAAKERERASHLRNRERRNAYSRGRWTDPVFRAQQLEANRAWHAAHRAEKAASVRAWREANPDRVKANLRRQYQKDPLRNTISSWMAKSLRRAGGSKAGRKFETLLGYSLATLKAHLERQFDVSMTWGNYGTAWEVDHVLPIASFTFSSTDDADFKAAWALTNLRPLGKRANRSKGGKRTLLI